MPQESGSIVNIDGRQRRSSALATREKILRAAIEEIADRGYERARLVDIAERADLTVGSVYTWFKNKSDLFNAALEYSLAEQQTRNMSFLQSDGVRELGTEANSHWMMLIASLAPRNTARDNGPTDAQKLLIEALKSAWRDEESYDTVRPQIATLFDQYKVIITNAMDAGAIDKALDADLLARLFLAFPVGLSLLTLAGLPDPDPAAFIPFFERFDKTLRPQE
jgi:AcrR family transcriptional regulator